MVLISPDPDVGCQNVRGLSSYLKQKGHEVILLNLPMREKAKKIIEFTSSSVDVRESKEEIDEIVRFIEAQHPALVGISLMSPFIDRAIALTEAIRQNIEAPVIWGGIHPSTCPEESIQHADIICLWEGEEPLLELANCLQEGKSCHEINNLWFNEGGRIIKNPIRPLVTDLDKYPFPDYDFDTNFILHNGKIVKIDDKLLEVYMLRYSRRFDIRTDVKTEFSSGVSYRILVSRGCPYGCTYCCNSIAHEVFGPMKIRRRSVQSVIDELVSIRERFGFVIHISISDENFLVANEKWVEEFCEQYKNKIRLPFCFQTHPNTMHQDSVRKLVDAGLAQAFMGIQTGSEDVNRDVFKRIQSNLSVVKSARFLKQFKKLLPIYDIIVDNPFEKEEDEKKTLELLMKLPKPYYLTIYSLMFFPNTPLFKRAVEEGIIDKNYDRFRKEDYTHFDYGNYYNLLFLTAPFLPNVVIKVLTRKNVVFRSMLLVFAKKRERFAGAGSYLLSLFRRI